MTDLPQLAEAVANQIGIALANLRLHASLHEQAIHDPLTGLYNRRYLEGALLREIARAQRGGRALSVLMLDIDHFKDFNDSYGHEAGDAVLKALGQVFKDSCRQADIACRFGGEEFTLVLPDADESAARDWATRLLARVRTMPVRANGQALPTVTISAGLALLPTHGEDAETLLQAADLALYDAKHAGRDRLVVSGELHAKVDAEAVIPDLRGVIPDSIRDPVGVVIPDPIRDPAPPEDWIAGQARNDKASVNPDSIRDPVPPEDWIAGQARNDKEEARNDKEEARNDKEETRNDKEVVMPDLIRHPGGNAEGDIA